MGFSANKKQFWDVEYVYIKRLVVWNMNVIFPYIGNNTPNWLSYFSEG